MNSTIKKHYIKTIFLCLNLILLSVSESFASDKYLIKKVNENVYIITEIWEWNSNGNIGLVIGEEGVLLINTLMMNRVQDLEKEIKKITDKPIKYVINSDHDPYNHHANKYFHDKGATIFSHQNLKYSTAFTDILFENEISIPIGNEIVTAYHTPTHTLDHVDIYLKNSNVLFTSDAINRHWFSYTGSNGIKGYLESVDKAISIADNQTIIVTGNTSKDQNNYLYNKKDLIEMRGKHEALSERIKELNGKGLKAEDIAKDKKIDQLAKDLDAYTTHYPYIKDIITEAIETNSDNCFKLTKNQLYTLAGKYKLNENSSIEIIVDNEKIYAREEGAFFFELAPLSETKFDFKAVDGNNYIEFQLTTKGKIKGLTTILEKDGWWFNIIKEGIREKI